MTVKALCWLVTRSDGEVMRATSLDANVEVTATGYEGSYRSSAAISGSAIKNTGDMSVDNLDISGALSTARQVSLSFFVTGADVEGGLWDQSRIKVFEVDAADTSQVTVLLNGVVGQITRTHEGEYRAEVRNLFQLLQQNIGEQYSLTCRAVLGSGAETPVIKRCGVDLSLFAVTGSITAINRDRYDWTDSTRAEPILWFRDGIVTWTSGLNVGIRSQVRRHPSAGRIILDTATPWAMQTGDAYSMTPGCDHRLIRTADGGSDGPVSGDCYVKFNNLINFRGEADLPGMDAIIAGEGEQ